jgi:hypothetical protein
MQIILAEKDGSFVHHHGIATPPSGMTEDDAVRKISEVVKSVKDANPEGWNYGEVLVELENEGFKVGPCIVWWE